MESQRIAAQQIRVGALASTLPDLEEPVLVAGSTRSTRVAPWAELVGDVHVFDGSAAHNPSATVETARGYASEVGARTVVAVGSAAAIDLGKAIVEAHPAALVAVPTTLGGSEMNRVYGSRHPDGTKRGGGGSALLPSVVCYDPELLATLPGDVLVASGVNAWAHSIEALYARREHWVGKGCAAGAGRTLPDLLAQAARGRDHELHASLFEAACLAGFAMNACGMGLHHAICHVLGGLTGLGHAALNVAVLPAAVQTNARLAPDEVGETLTTIAVGSVGPRVRELAELFGVPATLRDLGVSAAQLDAAVPAVMAAHHLGNNPAPPTEADVRRTLQAAFEGSDLAGSTTRTHQ